MLLGRGPWAPFGWVCGVTFLASQLPLSSRRGQSPSDCPFENVQAPTHIHPGSGQLPAVLVGELSEKASV